VEDRGPEVEQDIVRLCASEPWGQAVAEVVLPDEQRAAVPALLPYRVWDEARMSQERPLPSRSDIARLTACRTGDWLFR